MATRTGAGGLCHGPLGQELVVCVMGLLGQGLVGLCCGHQDRGWWSVSWPTRTGAGGLCHGPLGQGLVACVMAH